MSEKRHVPGICVFYDEKMNSIQRVLYLFLLLFMYTNRKNAAAKCKYIALG
jgi:hypothetical protein